MGGRFFCRKLFFWLMRIMAVVCLFGLLSISAFSQNDSTFWDNGNVKSVTTHNDDSTKTITYYQSGQLHKIDFYINQFYWVWAEEYCENGQLIKKSNPNCEEPGLVREYHCDGTLFMEYYRCRKGYRGLFKVFHKNGSVAEQGHFEASNNPIGDQKVGLWESFDVNGKKFYEAYYENGILVREKQFTTENGN